MEVLVYTDGAAIGNPGPGGYGVILQYGQHRKELSAGFRLTTNNRMELLALIVALEALKRENLRVIAYTDSEYVRNAIEKGWLFNWQKTNFKNKKNPDLWRRFLAVYSKHQVTVRWIKGHAGHPENERCDQLATHAARYHPGGIDEVYEKEHGGGSAGLF